MAIAVLFSIGRVRVAKTLLECKSVETTDLVAAFGRFLRGDWGDVSAQQEVLNDLAIVSAGAATGVYKSAAGTEFWIQKAGEGTRVMLPRKVPEKALGPTG